MPITAVELAIAYDGGDDATAALEAYNIGSLWRCLVEDQYNELRAATGVRVTFGPGQPWAEGKAKGQDSAAYLFDFIARTNTLPISTDFNESELNGERGNLLFRAAHDLCHYLCDLEHRDEGHRCNFALDGETRAFERQARGLLALYDRLERRLSSFNTVNARLIAGERAKLVQIAFSEIILQAAVFYQTGSFAEQKVVLVPMDIINGWLKQNGLAPLAA